MVVRGRQWDEGGERGGWCVVVGEGGGVWRVSMARGGRKNINKIK